MERCDRFARSPDQTLVSQSRLKDAELSLLGKFAELRPAAAAAIKREELPFDTSLVNGKGYAMSHCNVTDGINGRIG